MNGNSFLLDTNISLGCVKGDETALGFVGERSDSALYVSVITRMELLAFSGLTSEQEEIIHNFLGDTSVVPLNADVERIAIALRRETRRKLPDAIVAATAVWLGAPLATADKKLSKTVFQGLRTIYVPMPSADPSQEPVP